MKRFTLDEQDFRHLVGGGTLEMTTDKGEKVQIAFSDFGAARMAMACAEATYAREQLLGKVRKVE